MKRTKEGPSSAKLASRNTPPFILLLSFPHTSLILCVHSYSRSVASPHFSSLPVSFLTHILCTLSPLSSRASFPPLAPSRPAPFPAHHAHTRVRACIPDPRAHITHSFLPKGRRSGHENKIRNAEQSMR